MKQEPIPPPELEDDYTKYCEWSTQHESYEEVAKINPYFVYKALIVVGLLAFLIQLFF